MGHKLFYRISIVSSLVFTSCSRLVLPSAG